MKHINWFARLFMSWKSLEDYFKKETNEGTTIAVLEERLAGKNKEVLLAQELKDGLQARYDETQKEKDKISITLQEILNKLEVAQQANTEKEQSLAIKTSEIENLKNEIRERKSSLDKLRTDIHERLSPLNRIEKTFFGSSGNKGKGELGEMQLKVLLEKSGLESDLWTENLVVGTTSIEFAIQSGNNDGKWIPIDSKVLDTVNVDEEGLIVVDETYRRKVGTQVKAVTKYLGKSNTTEYGLLVLQSDAIYMSLYNEFPSFFKEMIEEHKIYIASPSSFIQMAWSISHIIKIFERINKDQKIYNDMISMLESVHKFGKKIAVTHDNFNIAMLSHYPTIRKKYEKLSKKLVKEGKITELPTIESK